MAQMPNHHRTAAPWHSAAGRKHPTPLLGSTAWFLGIGLLAFAGTALVLQPTTLLPELPETADHPAVRFAATRPTPPPHSTQARSAFTVLTNLALSADGRYGLIAGKLRAESVAAERYHACARLWFLERGRPNTGTDYPHLSSYEGRPLALAPHGSALATVGTHQTIIWSLPEGRWRHKISFDDSGGEPDAVCFTADGGELVLINRHQITRVRCADGVRFSRPMKPRLSEQATFVPQLQCVVDLESANQSVQCVQVPILEQARERARRLEAVQPAARYTFAVSANGRYLAVDQLGNRRLANYLSIHLLATGQIAARIPRDRVLSFHHCLRLALSPDGAYVAAIVADRELPTVLALDVFRVATGERTYRLVWPVPKPSEVVVSLGFTPNGPRLFAILPPNRFLHIDPVWGRELP